MLRKIIFIFFVLAFQANLIGQDSRLANQYYQSGEYEKAAALYQDLLTASRNNDYYFNRYIECLLALEQFKECEKAIKKQISGRPNHVQLYVTYGNLFERMGEPEKAEKQYQDAIKNLPAERNIIYNLGNAFLRLTKYDYAIETYERGTKLMDSDHMFAYQQADLYRRKGDRNNMIYYFLRSLNNKNSRISNIKNYFQRNLQQEDYPELQAQIFERLQEDPENNLLPELLEWVYIQSKDYKRALRQAKALDKRLDENGLRAYNLAQIASNDRDYETAINAYEYIISEKGPNTAYYIESKRELLNCKRKILLSTGSKAPEALADLENEYISFINEIGWNKQSALLISELANLEAFYINDLDKAISLLKDMIDYPGVNRYIRANSKLSLGDFYLMQGEIWESTLLYSQVDKEFREDYLGEQARFKNAKLSYYNGDFEWAQSQFDILKASTSKLISNDAIDLSVFIMDNLNLDTIDIPMKLYAKSDLLIFQNRLDDALTKLDSIEHNYPDHTLEDDIHYARAQIYKQREQYDLAESALQIIINDHPDEIRADNAIYQLALLYEEQLNKPSEAMALYEKLFIDYSSSTFAIEARKRFRVMRGDEIQ